MKNKYLVCGAGGFIGGHLVKSLMNDGHTVVCADVKPLENWFQKFDSNNNFSLDLKEYEKQKMSGVLPLSFSYGCQLIIPESWNKFYSFTSAIEYNKTTKILLNKNTNLDDIYNELYVLQNHKQDIISNILNIPKKYDIPIINFINDLGFKIPLILIDFKSNINLEE